VPAKALLARFVAPHAVLHGLHAPAAAVLVGQGRARGELRRRIQEAAGLLPQAADLGRDLLEAAPRGVDARTQDRREAVSTLDERGFAGLAAALTKCFEGDDGSGLAVALQTLLGLAALAEPANRLLTALEDRGPGGFVDELEWILTGRQLQPPTMQTLSGSLPIPIPGGGVPRVPPAGPPELPPGLGDDLADWLRRRFGKPKRVDLDIWDHRPISLIEGPEFVDMQRIRCQLALIAALLDRREPPPKRPARVVWSDTIARIEAGNACAGDRIVIHGRAFGARKPADVGLVIPVNGVCTPMDVSASAWGDTRIELTLPAGITSGPIGFVDLSYVAAYNAWVDRQNDRRANAIAAARCAAVTIEDIPVLRYFSECPPATPFNGLRAGGALIRAFTANWQATATVEPSDAITLAWDVVNAEHIRIRRITPEGPLLSGSLELFDPPAVGSLALGPAGHTRRTEFRYRLTATGPCPTAPEAAAEVRILATKTPALRVSGIEVIQVLQRFNPVAPGPADNSVPLVSRRKTLVRVYVDSGLTDGFDHGAGPNTVPGITGKLSIVVTPPVDLDPVNAGGVVTAQPVAAIAGKQVGGQPLNTRGQLGDTLNFELPADRVDGTRPLRVHVFPRDPALGSGPGWEATGATTVTFRPRRRLRVLVIQIRDDRLGLSAPSLNRAAQGIRGVLERYPVADDGVDLLINNQVLGTNRDLSKGGEWDALLNDVGEFSESFQHNYDVLAAITPAVPTYANNGIGSATSAWPPVFVAQVGLEATFAHELAHTQSVGHALCPTSGSDMPTGIDPNLPANARTEDVGFWPRRALLVPSGTSELMSYCTPTWPAAVAAAVGKATRQDRWPSIALWTMLFNKLA
jgi:hypothetical protein